MKPKNRRNNPFVLAAITLTLAAPALHAASYYWDTDADTPGAGGATPSGTWVSSGTTWSPDSTGSVLTPPYTTQTVDDLTFSTGTDAIGSYIITLATSELAKSLTFENGTTTISGAGTISLGGGGGITVLAGAGNPIISTGLTINGRNLLDVVAGSTLTLDTGAFDRLTNKATLNVPGAGTVTSTMTGLATGAMVNGIVGPWASFATGASTQYATFSGNDITGLTGTPALDATGVTDTGGTFNYDVAAVGTLGAGASVNTLRHTGTTGTYAGDLATKGIMNASSDGTNVTFSGAVTAGTKFDELVVNAANGSVGLNGLTTGALVKTGSFAVTLGAGAVHSLGSWTVNQGVLNLGLSGTTDALPGGTVNSGGTVKLNGGNSKVNNIGIFTINAGGTFDINGSTDLVGGMVGAGSIINSNATAANVHTNPNGANRTFSGVVGGGGGGTMGFILNGNGTQALTGLNTYTGVTDIRNGSLSVNTIKNVGVDSSIGAPLIGSATIKFGSGTGTPALVYTGTGDDTDRVIDFTGTSGTATLTQSGPSGLLKFNSPFGFTGVGSKTLTLNGGTAGTGEIVGPIINNATIGTTVSTAASTASTALVLASVNGLTVSSAISGTGIPASTTISAINTGTKTVTLSAAATVASGAVITSAGLVNITSLTKAGSGTWTISGANTYSGTTTVSGGTLKSGASGVIPDGSGKGNVSVTGTGTLDLNGFSETINGLSGSGSVDTVAGGTPTLTVGNAGGGGTFNGNIKNTAGTLALTKIGGGDIILTGTNTYSGLTTINTARLFISGANAFSPNTTVQVNGGKFTFNVSGDLTFSQSITLASGGGLSLRQAATLSNVTLPTSGSVNFNKDDQATVAFSLDSAPVLTAPLTVEVGGGGGAPGDVTLAGNISGTGGLIKDQAGKLILSGTNSYSGDTTVNTGNLELAATGQLKFVLGAISGTNNSLSGAGTVTLDGSFLIDTSAADALSSGTWTLENAASLPGAYGATFSVSGFLDAGTEKWTKTIGPKTYTFDETTGILTLVTSASSNYASWANDPTKGNIPGEPASGDFDNDGITNIVEYALGKNPRVSSQPAGVLAGSVITYTKGSDAIANGDVSWVIETSTTLGAGSWTPVVSQPAADPALTIAYTLTPGTPVKNFARLKVVQLP